MPLKLDEDTQEALLAQQNTGKTPEEIAAEAKAADKAAADKAAADANADKSQLPDITLNDGDKAVVKTLEEAGYDMDSIKKRIETDKGISDEFVAELKTKIDPVFVDVHVARIKAELELEQMKASSAGLEIEKKNKAILEMNDHIYKSVGSEANFQALSKVLKANLSEDAVATLNAKLASGNKLLVDEALKEAVKQYNYIKGKGGNLMEGDVGGATGNAEDHITKEEYRAIMRTEKYKTDPVYQQKIDAARLKTRAEDAAKYGMGSYFGVHPVKGKYAL